jgi:hypothetical protein
MLEAEWGSSAPIGLAKSTMVDSDGNEVPVRVCDHCGEAKTILISARAYQWVCYGCDNHMSSQEVMTKSFLKNLAS